MNPLFDKHAPYMACARGDWQRSIVVALWRGETVRPIRDLRGRAKSYAGHYVRSMTNLFCRMEKSGMIEIDMVPGPRGGTCAASAGWRIDR